MPLPAEIIAKLKGRRVVLAGCSGLVGGRLIRDLEAAGAEITQLVRREPKPGQARWSPAERQLDAGLLDGVDAVVNLAGVNVAQRWTETAKRQIRESRVDATTTLAAAIAASANPPVLVNASAIGYYGDTGDREVDETADLGTGFLAEVCRDWEAATAAAESAGGRVVRVRIGVVLDPAGGALGAMLTPFRLGVGGVVGSGRQYMSWVDGGDLADILIRAIVDDRLSGAVNATAPQPATNREFTKALGAALHRPTVLPMPGAVLRLALGQMAGEMLLNSQRILPRKLQALGHDFAAPDVSTALQRLLG